MGSINIIAFNPPSNDGAALGTTALQWSDLFLASGGVINWANGNVTMTHASALLTMAGGDFLLNRSSATALQVGPNGATNPTLTVVTNTSSGATGLSITNAASGSGVTLAAKSTATDDNMILAAKGAGKIQFPGGSGTIDIFDGRIDTSRGTFYINYTYPGSTISLCQDKFIFINNKFSIGAGTPTYGLHIAPTSGVTAAQTVFVQDATASTGQTKMILKGGAVAGTIFEVQDSAAGVKTTLTDAGLLKSISLYASGDGSGLASTTGVTNVTNTTLTNAYVVNGGQAATTSNTGWIKVYVGTVVSWIPYWSNATP